MIYTNYPWRMKALEMSREELCNQLVMLVVKEVQDRQAYSDRILNAIAAGVTPINFLQEINSNSLAVPSLLKIHRESITEAIS